MGHDWSRLVDPCRCDRGLCVRGKLRTAIWIDATCVDASPQLNVSDLVERCPSGGEKINGTGLMRGLRADVSVIASMVTRPSVCARRHLASEHRHPRPQFRLQSFVVRRSLVPWNLRPVDDAHIMITKKRTDGVGEMKVIHASSVTTLFPRKTQSSMCRNVCRRSDRSALRRGIVCDEPAPKRLLQHCVLLNR